MDKEVSEYIEKQKSPQKEILKIARRLLLKTIPGCGETMAWGVPVYAGGKFYIAAMKNRVHIGFAIKGLNEEEKSLFEGSGKTMRHVKINSLEDIEAKDIAKLIDLINKKAVCKPC